MYAYMAHMYKDMKTHPLKHTFQELFPTLSLIFPSLKLIQLKYMEMFALCAEFLMFCGIKKQTAKRLEHWCPRLEVHTFPFDTSMT